GVARLADLQGVPSSAPAVGGPFHREGAPAVWAADDATATLVADGEGTPIYAFDRSGGAAEGALTPALLRLRATLRAAAQGLR
ncbi:MAG TPA: hypothetical protein VKE69_07630, partial [Planctomycetota bacterium]|nr:hypothetical protein [Planctomycetota bacterium]